MTSADEKAIFFVMGIQRSGGSTLLDAFRRKRNVSIFTEKDKRFFENFFLKPEALIRPLLEESKQFTFIEAKSETKIRNVIDLFSEFSQYNVKVIWNYRNPVRVYYSRLIKYPLEDWVVDHNQFCEMWNHRNGSVLNALNQYRDDIAIVKLEDLIESKMMFKQLCDFVGVKGRNKFFRDKKKIEKYISEKIIENITDRTSTVLYHLDVNRRFIP